MDYEKLIKAVNLCGSTPKVEQCKKCAYWAGGDMSKCIPRMTTDAATALATFQAENEKLQTLSKLGNMRAQDYRIMRDRAVKAENENEKLRAELEQTRENNKKLIAAMMMIQKSEDPERMHVVYEMDYSTAIDHQTARDIAVIVFDGLMREDLRLRGQRED